MSKPIPRVCKFCRQLRHPDSFALVEKPGAVRLCRKRVCMECFPEHLREKASIGWSDYIFRKYKLTPADFQALGNSQNWRCAICSTDTPPLPKGGRIPWRAWHIDHDHATNTVRGLLCANCNFLLGQARDKITILDAAQRYLLINKHTIAYCGGTFDLLHPGHVLFFKWAKDTFGRVVVSLNSDSFVARYKTPPAQSLMERREMLESCRYVDDVITNVGDEDSKPSILCIKPTHVVNGSDWSNEKLMAQMSLTEEFLAENKITIALCPLERIFSTTELKQRIKGNGKH